MSTNKLKKKKKDEKRKACSIAVLILTSNDDTVENFWYPVSPLFSTLTDMIWQAKCVAFLPQDRKTYIIEKELDFVLWDSINEKLK